ncbi:ribosome silencing factor [Schleiferilactobacillus harbinensis]|uniref:Ribosomal silencing factor RsfS n=1 Tax=Schleiferilactobacillus harbinensis TaxID=304207 RepID=A0A5P2TT30_9LACO|nr:ribosome silencing factor [Schleiferilactobacillus harbinensis]QEU46844.1 ribosome silencing factor [Schleiferilactobacillus harbinensis]QFR23887.1 ribosome silencing factor [Schleiferilactobacillus harbinensis]QFR65228.1 ribosome silencing factor [Schleiferilactobacillus harbinensis]HAY52851.1 ribosome silencing factor [Lactobacillus sp.]
MPGCAVSATRRTIKGVVNNFLTSAEKLQVAVEAADKKHAEEIVALNMEEVSLLADYFVIMHGNSERQVQAIVEGIIEAEEAAGVTVQSVEGKKDSRWMLIDLGDVVVHVFTKEERAFYNLEKLWSDAPLVDVHQWITA